MSKGSGCGSIFRLSTKARQDYFVNKNSLMHSLQAVLTDRTRITVALIKRNHGSTLRPSRDRPSRIRNIFVKAKRTEKNNNELTKYSCEMVKTVLYRHSATVCLIYCLSDLLYICLSDLLFLYLSGCVSALLSVYLSDLLSAYLSDLLSV